MITFPHSLKKEKQQAGKVMEEDAFGSPGSTWRIDEIVFNTIEEYICKLWL